MSGLVTFKLPTPIGPKVIDLQEVRQKRWIKDLKQEAARNFSNGIAHAIHLGILCRAFGIQDSVYSGDFFGKVAFIGALHVSDILTKRIAGRVFEPFYSLDNCSANMIGTVGYYVSRFAIPFFLLRNYGDIVATTLNLSGMWNRSMPISDVTVGIALACLNIAWPRKSSESEVKDSTKDPKLTYTGSSSEKDGIVNILKNNHGVKLEREDLIDGLVKLLGHYSFPNMNSNSMKSLQEYSETLQEQSASSFLYEKVEFRGEELYSTFGSFMYMLDNNDVEALEDEMRDDLTKFGISQLPDRLYPKKEVEQGQKSDIHNEKDKDSDKEGIVEEVNQREGTKKSSDTAIVVYEEKDSDTEHSLLPNRVICLGYK